MMISLKILLLLSTILYLSTLSTPTSALRCECNSCGGADFCDTSADRESQCYKSVDKVESNGTYFLEASFGCLSGGGLSHLQCHAGRLWHQEVKFIKCCNQQDYCNGLLPDPTVEDDPRWSIDPADNPKAPVDPEQAPEFYWKFLCILLMAIILTCIALILFIFQISKCYLRDPKDNTTCPLKAELDKFHHQHLVASTSASTHSYSISDDLCHKTISDPTNEDSFLPEDLTSGLGERMLNQRTMARAIGCGQTDHVGNGRFGRVFRGQYHGEDVAVKAFRTIDQDSWKREDTIFRLLNHESIVRFIASEVTSVENTTTEIWMFLEYCPYGSLCDYLDHNEVMGPEQAVRILYSIINGLNYLHEDYAQASRLYKPSIAHRDIKSKNILMKTPESCCIADFGHALIKMNEESLDYGKYQHLQVGTVRYMAPEILRPHDALNYRHFSTFAQADLYQFGLILWEVCQRTTLDVLHPAGQHKLPYDGVVPQNPDIQDMVKIVCDDQYRPPRYEKWDRYVMMKRLSELMVECWRPNSKARMETLGVKKKIKEMYDKVMPSISHQYQLNLFNNSSLSPSASRNDRDKTKSSDITM